MVSDSTVIQDAPPRLSSNRKPPPPGKKGPRPRHNWQNIRVEYARGDGSLAQLADRHGISRSTMLHRCAREGWAKNATKLSQPVQDAVRAQIREKVQPAADKLVAATIERSERLLAKMDDLLSSNLHDDHDSEGGVKVPVTAKFERIVSSFAKLVAIGRQAHGLDSSSHTVNVRHVNEMQVECVDVEVVPTKELRS